VSDQQPDQQPASLFGHLLRMTDHRATFEHARVTDPRREDGYCTDDMAGVLVVATREPDAAGEVNGLAGKALTYLNDAQSFNGACRNRMDRGGHWTDQPTTHDHWGRMVWALGTAAAHSGVSLVRRLAVIQFERAAQTRSASPRAMAFAALGAAELLTFAPDHPGARKLLVDYAATVPEAADGAEWPWPGTHLTYADAVLAEAMIATGVALEDPALRQRGLDALEWLLAYETADQQPLEMATLADACARAAAVDPRPLWPEGIRSAAAWFEGANDAGLPMWDPATGGGFDGPSVDGVRDDQGAESTLAVISTMQHVRRLSGIQPTP
jgi:hypothetical protein